MKVKITVEEPFFTLQIIDYINKQYKNWLDYTVFKCHNAGIKIDIYQFMEEITNAALTLKYKKQIKLFYNKTSERNQLDMWVLRQISNRIDELSRQKS